MPRANSFDTFSRSENVWCERRSEMLASRSLFTASVKPS
jgi:hypothetical protein